MYAEKQVVPRMPFSMAGANTLHMATQVEIRAACPQQGLEADTYDYA
jgi:hypothetical protein